MKNENMKVSFTYLLGLAIGFFILDKWWGIPICALVFYFGSELIDKITTEEVHKTETKRGKK